MSIIKSETFSQIEIFFTFSFSIAKLVNINMAAKLMSGSINSVVLLKDNGRFFFFLSRFNVFYDKIIVKTFNKLQVV